MKKIFVLLLLLILNVSMVYAEKDYSVHFNGKKFNLLYSIKNKDFGGYLNEYYKKGETYNIWSEMVAVHHFPNAYSPIDRIKDFKDYLGSMHVPSSLTFDDKKNTAMIDFVMINDHSVPVVIEFNIFKYEKSKKCGSIAIQYARRYTATTTMQIEYIKKDIEKNRKNLITKVKNFGIPEIVTKDIDKCISAADIINDDKPKATEDITASTQNTGITTKEEVVSEQNTESASGEEAKNNTAEENKPTEETQTVQEERILTKSSEDNNSITDENSKEEPSKSPERENTISEKIKSDETPQKAEEKQDVLAAPVPATDYTNKNKTIKKNKNDIDEVSNNKNEYIAVPRTKKELKEEIKAKRQKQKDNAKQAKIQAKASKKAAKIEAINNKKQEKIEKNIAKSNLKQQKKQDKINKKEAKKTEKTAKKPYTVSNNNSDLIANPRTKKEIKANNKIKRKKSKERVKQAKKKLNS